MSQPDFDEHPLDDIASELQQRIIREGTDAVLNDAPPWVILHAALLARLDERETQRSEWQDRQAEKRYERLLNILDSNGVDTKRPSRLRQWGLTGAIAALIYSLAELIRFFTG